MTDTDTVERVAKAINGPRDAAHIGTEKLHELQDYKWINQTTPQERIEKLSAARAAIAALPPAVPVLSVRYLSMPESNGRENWTAILCADGKDDMTDGYCFARSEYPDRVRYAADRMRFLIGKTDKRPYILDYDEDKCSDYVPPTTPDPVAEAEARENIVDEIENIISETHELDVRDVDYAENIVSWLERHHPAALRALTKDGEVG